MVKAARSIFRNTLIIIPPLSLGCEHLLNLGDGESVQKAKVGVMQSVSAHSPEFLNRSTRFLLLKG